MQENNVELIERLVELKRVSKVIKGGKRLKLYACVVVGDGAGRVGIGHAKSAEVAPAIKKATEIAKKNMVKIDVVDGTILHPVMGKFSASKVLLKPALPGSGIIASNSVRAVCQAAGIKDILSKAFGSRNPTNLAMATIKALRSIRGLQTVAEMRNKPIEYFLRKRYEKDKSDSKEESN
jgi:small subunit ribosomal protein S5|uniref:Small ribosomal subunit protein uS5 n=1 Tax=candidate division WOR-3 bacterium TaxID=2052148 RepID=A0A7V3RIT2_UNCW3